MDREREKPTEKDVKEWAATESTMNKYRERYKEEWKAKLSEVVAKNDRETIMKTFKEYENIDKKCEECIFEHELEGIQEAEYQGKKVKLNDPIRGGSKKFYVYVKDDDKGKIKVSFGDTTGLSIKRDDPARRKKSFRARHNCDNPDQKLKQGTGHVINGELGAKVNN